MRQKKIIRNCVAHFFSRSQTTVYYQLHFSVDHMFQMPAAEWDMYPDI